MSSDRFIICGIAGSLRRHSYNRALLRAAREEAPAGISIEIVDLEGLPVFNEDLALDGDPSAVQALKARIAQAQALLIATPEYNYNIPAPLKNAIDWVSYTPDDAPSVLTYKPVALMGASLGPFGTVRAQLALRQVLHYTDSYVLPKPELHVPRAFERFDAEGALHDERTRAALRCLLEALVTWARQLDPFMEVPS
jgi:chromate reductase, NAD(P)H dehydrogenase (quinone)